VGTRGLRRYPRRGFAIARVATIAVRSRSRRKRPPTVAITVETTATITTATIATIAVSGARHATFTTSARVHDHREPRVHDLRGLREFDLRGFAKFTTSRASRGFTTFASFAGSRPLRASRGPSPSRLREDLHDPAPLFARTFATLTPFAIAEAKPIVAVAASAGARDHDRTGAAARILAPGGALRHHPLRGSRRGRPVFVLSWFSFSATSAASTRLPFAVTEA
jgi:hypothetical protein